MAAIVAVVVVLAVGGPLVAQFPRDYLFALGQDSSRPQGSRYAALLAHLGRPTDVVETDYESTVGLFTGHRAANSAFLTDLDSCDLSASTAALAGDNAGFLLLGAVNKPNLIDNLCLAREAASEPWAVELLHTARDDATVYELIGAGTAHPNLTDLTASADLATSGATLRSGPGAAATAAVAGTGWLEWAWDGAHAVTQVTVDRATAGAATTAVSVQLQEPGRGWVTVASVRSAVGDDRGDAPYLLATPAAGTEANAVRVVVDGRGLLQAGDVTVLGPAGSR